MKHDAAIYSDDNGWGGGTRYHVVYRNKNGQLRHTRWTDSRTVAEDWRDQAERNGKIEN